MIRRSFNPVADTLQSKGLIVRLKTKDDGVRFSKRRLKAS